MKSLTSPPRVIFAAIFLGVVAWESCGSAKADSAEDVVCRCGFVSAEDQPHYPQRLNEKIAVMTDAATPAGSYSVTVSDPDTGNNVAVYYFDVAAGGIITGGESLSKLVPYGVAAGEPACYYSTVVGTYQFSGNNFPVSADSPTKQFDPTTTHRNFLLSYHSQMQNLTILSRFTYDHWAGAAPAISFWSGPYTKGASSAFPDKYGRIIFDMREGVAVDPGADCPACDADASTGCSSCSGGSGGNQPIGMAVASLDRWQSGIVISDTPVGYTPPVGMGMNLTVAYHQRLVNQPATPNYSNFGPQWHFSFLSYIKGGPVNNEDTAVHVTGSGSEDSYRNYVTFAPQGTGTTFVNQGDYNDNQGRTHATLHYRQAPERYELWYSDGSVATFAQGAGTAPDRYFFLTSIKDPQGNVTTLTYDPTAATTGKAILTAITDPTGKQLQFNYGDSDALKITKVTRSNDGLSAKFQYSGGRLTSITDTIGITSSFHYTSGTGFIDKMTTPYGASTFSSADGTGYLEADMTNPLGQTERVEYRQSLATSLVAASDPHAPSATGLSVTNDYLNTANSFYWTRRAMSDAAAGSIAPGTAAFYALAQVTHWAHDAAGSVYVPLSTKRPLEGRIWYNYPGQLDPTTFDFQATAASTSASAVARVLDDNSTQASFAAYNSHGMLVQSIDPVGRTTDYTYATNGIDVVEVSQVNGGSDDILSTITYNTQHLPLTVTDASGQTATMTYNTFGQLLTRTNAKGETTSSAYNNDHFLSEVTGPVSGATTSFTYDSAGRVHTVTDSEGYIVTTSYDNLDRPTMIAYPDGTTSQIVYDRLDVAKQIDRQGRISSIQYDAIREVLQTIDPLGQTVKYAWCTCGGLSRLTDANGNVTIWGLDLQGRVTSRTYADNTQIDYNYESTTSRLHETIDACGSTASYAYNTDNTLASITYTSGAGVASTPSINFAYDSAYSRVVSMTDGTGTTTYSYNGVYSGGVAITGGGLLHTVTAPIAGSTATIDYGYDELGRVTGRQIDHATTNANNVSTTFDNLGRVTELTNALGTFDFSYINTTGRLASVSYPNWQKTDYDYYNNIGDQRLKEIKNYVWGVFSNTPLSKFDYTYNTVGTIATWTQQTDNNTPTEYALTYDATNQLINAVQTNTSTSAVISSNSYNYDPAGNRLAETTDTTTTAGRFNNLNQLTAVTSSAASTTIAGHASSAISSATVNAIPATITNSTNFTASVPLPAGTNAVAVVASPTSGKTITQRVQVVTAGTSPTALTYDANGNTVTDENGNIYQWDALNHLTKMTYPSGASSLFAYDGLGRRAQIIEKDASNAVTSTKNYLWVGTEMVEERNESNSVTKRFFPQGEQQSGTAYYYSRDHLGSVREMVSNTDSIQARYQYDLYGRTSLVSGSNLSTFQYGLLMMHEPSALYLARRRAFAATTGRWLSRDPISENGGLNLYNYSVDDPAYFVDPSGKSCADWIALGGLVGAAGGLAAFWWSGPGEVVAGPGGYAVGGAAVGVLTGCALGVGNDLSHVHMPSVSIPQAQDSSIPKRKPKSNYKQCDLIRDDPPGKIPNPCRHCHQCTYMCKGNVTGGGTFIVRYQPLPCIVNVTAFFGFAPGYIRALECDAAVEAGNSIVPSEPQGLNPEDYE